ncbi:response regulator [candidate division KSB1 bacterium]|nr:response regulator [candidate division KSB1 bacterium]NIR68960.1 response regulator [candidate division KSB1 bacterium]NIS22584.1 response regulator [candidate division KSB1 bacterium]NIT69444.1 response regulator [candidate division KSB1 bacterium]NIU23099.1 response regulator [candidate division KSB1 bacterium]
MNNSKSILIIDDEETIVDVLKRRFERLGFSVETAFRGQDGLQLVQQKDIDLIVCDVTLPDNVDCIDVLNAARKQNPNVRFVAISGHLLPEESIGEMKNEGVNLFIKKPFPSLKTVTSEIAELVT